LKTIYLFKKTMIKVNVR